MAKMFYSLEEAAQQLGITEEQIKQLAATGKLQQFRDKDKLMFKRDQVDAMTKKSGSGGPIPLAMDDTSIDKSESATLPGGPALQKEDSGVGLSPNKDSASFDSDHGQTTDPKSQTQVSRSIVDEEELALENVGSGSGLLDLTRESDDTSLGAELLDEIYPGGEMSDSKLDSSIIPSGSGTLELGGAASESGISQGLDHLQGAPQQSIMPVSVAAQEIYDPAGSGMSTGMLLGAFAALVILLIVAISASAGVPVGVTTTIGHSSGTIALYCGGLLVASILLGLVGFFIGKSKG